MQVPGEYKSRLKDSTRIDYARSRSKNKDAGAGGAGAAIHTAATTETCDIEVNPLHIFKSVTDYIECHQVESGGTDGRSHSSHMYECFMAAEVDELGALLAATRTYKEAMKMPDANNWNVSESSVQRVRYPMEPRKSKHELS